LWQNISGPLIRPFALLASARTKSIRPASPSIGRQRLADGAARSRFGGASLTGTGRTGSISG